MNERKNLKKGNHKYLDKRINKKLLRYDHKLAKLDGVKGSILDDVKSLGAEITNYEALSHYGFSLVEIRKELKIYPHYIKPLPHFWKFTTPHPL